MKKYQKLKNPLLFGTLLLTASGVLCRVIGFLYRIFLSRTIGARELGIYQLVFPISVLLLSLCSSGIQTAISNFLAGRNAKKDNSLPSGRYIFGVGFLFAGTLSVLFTLLLWNNAEFFAELLLDDIAYSDHLRIVALYTVPASVHACIDGFYYGKKQAVVPSLSQFLEQLGRVVGVYIIHLVVSENGGTLSAAHALWGLVIGELFGLLTGLISFYFLPGVGRTASHPRSLREKAVSLQKAAGEALRFAPRMLAYSVPLMFNHTLLHLCSCTENMMIPGQLQRYGYSPSQALEIFGILSGMVISVIFFPCVLTNSMSVLLLPAISEAKAVGDADKIHSYVRRSVVYGLLIGFFFTLAFLCTGHFIGDILFHNATAGSMICRLSWICPFLFVHSLFSGILQGLGKVGQVLFINILSFGIRVGALFLLVPAYGEAALMWGMILAQFFCVVADLFTVWKIRI